MNADFPLFSILNFIRQNKCEFICEMKNGELQLESDFDVVEKQGVSKEYLEIQKILQEKE